jgi:chromosomal replication initiator protein
LSKFSSKLKNRCQGGVCAAIELLSSSSREKLLTHFAGERGFTLAPDVAALLAGSLTVSPRELRGIVCRLELLARQLGRPIDHDLAEAVIGEIVVAARPTLSQITKTVAKAFSVSAADLKSEARLQGLVLPRQLAMFAAKEWAQQAYSEIGRYFGRRSHSTIVHACQRVRSRLEADPDFQRVVETIQEQLRIPQRGCSHDSTTC